MSASLGILSGLATAGIDAAKVAVLVVLGAFVAFAAAVWGTKKVLVLLGYDGAFDGSGAERGTSSRDVMDGEYAEAADPLYREDWADGGMHGWSNASGTDDADYHKWRY